MSTPPYYKQNSNYTCSLAGLKMVLAHYDKKVTEEELREKIESDYGKNFTNLWNPTIARLAREYGIQTTMYALWPLFKKDILPIATEEYKKNPETMNVNKYENSKDDDHIPEPLPLAYKDMFEAVKLGCKVVYGQLTEKRLKSIIGDNGLIQTSIKLHKLYPGKKKVFHSILIYEIKDNKVLYHDPSHGKSLSCTVNHLLKATIDVGVFMAYTT